MVKEFARIEASSICCQLFANAFADCFYAVHKHQLELPTRVELQYCSCCSAEVLVWNLPKRPGIFFGLLSEKFLGWWVLERGKIYFGGETNSKYKKVDTDYMHRESAFNAQSDLWDLIL